MLQSSREIGSLYFKSTFTQEADSVHSTMQLYYISYILLTNKSTARVVCINISYVELVGIVLLRQTQTSVPKVVVLEKETMAVTCRMFCVSLLVVMMVVSSYAAPLAGSDVDKIAHVSGKCIT